MTGLMRVSNENGLWKEVVRDWERQCQRFDEDIGDYAQASLPVLEGLATETQRRSAGVYALQGDGEYLGLCQLNVTLLPGYVGPVLRVRHIVHAPRFDFESHVEVEDYTKVLGGILSGTYDASCGEMEAKHIKFHFKSPAERVFFEVLRDELRDHAIFSSIDLQGSWLYISK